MCIQNGYHGDLNETITVGNVDEEGKQVVRVAHDCLMKVRGMCGASWFRPVASHMACHMPHVRCFMWHLAVKRSRLSA